MAADALAGGAAQPSGADLAGMGTIPDVQTGGSAGTSPSQGDPAIAATGGDAASVDQFFLSIQEEELRSALFGQADGIRGRKKDPLDPSTA